MKLERERPEDAGPSDPLPDDGRFESIGGEARPSGEPAGIPGGGAPRTPVPESSTDRFRPPPERGLETAEARSGQPFTRCADCKVDNTVYAVRCQHCGADLDTPVQRAFNEKLWAEHRAEDDAAAKEIAERKRVQAAEAAEVARQQREIGEEIARRERQRVEDQYPEGPLGSGRFGRADTVGMRLLRLLPGTGWRVAAALVAFGIPLLLLLFGRGQPQVVGMLLLGVLISLFSPARARRRRW